MAAMADPSMNLQPLLDTRQHQLDLVAGVSEGIDAKSLAILGSDLAILIFIAQSNLVLAPWQWWLLLAPFLVSLVLDIAAIWPRKYSGNVSVEDHPEYLSMDEEDLILQLLANTEAAVKDNETLNRERLRYCTVSIGLSIVGSCALLYFLL